MKSLFEFMSTHNYYTHSVTVCYYPQLTRYIHRQRKKAHHQQNKSA